MEDKMKDRKVVIENLRKTLFHIAHYGYSDDKIVREAMEEAIPKLQQELAEARQETEAREAETLRLTLAVNDLRHEIETMVRDQNRYEQDRARMEREQERRDRMLAEMAGAETKDLQETAEREAALAAAREDQAQREKITQSLEEDRVARQARFEFGETPQIGRT